MEFRQCKKCGETYPLDRDHFGNTPSGGFRYTCRACVRTNVARHYAETPEKVLNRVARRKEQDREALGFYDDSDITQIRKKLGDRCRYCGKSLHAAGEVDHMIPISRGGSHWPTNLTLACLQCNKEKHGKTLDEYLAWREERGLLNRRFRR